MNEKIFNTHHFGQVIYKIISNSKLSNRQFADKLGLTESALYRIFKKENVGTDVLMRVLEIAGIDSKAIFTINETIDYNLKKEPKQNIAEDSQEPYNYNKEIKNLEKRIKELEADKEFLKDTINLIRTLHEDEQTGK